MKPVLSMVLVASCLASTVHARLFWQTYGAIGPAPDGQGCVWSLEQDYFVPRNCDTARYGLYSPCKRARTISPACCSLHPVYRGYCTPYEKFHYEWNDHVYRKQCGCTPRKCYCGPWRLEDCPKHACVLRHHGACGQSPACSAPHGEPLGIVAAEPWGAPSTLWETTDALANVEPPAGDSLGVLKVDLSLVGGLPGQSGVGLGGGTPRMPGAVSGGAGGGPRPLFGGAGRGSSPTGSGR